MPKVTPGAPSQPRVIAPTYAFDPYGIYADPHVQAWATYYANGGADLAGASYFISIPGLTDHALDSETVQSPVGEIGPSVPSAPVAPAFTRRPCKRPGSATRTQKLPGATKAKVEGSSWFTGIFTYYTKAKASFCNPLGDKHRSEYSERPDRSFR
ncbi:hypothetical protein IW261DRAFT_383972 [Armillaria novae-zelandiae]|uniref:Uncharacterized protein n=1 Tax=Armillaria novae-zelandiae TaxID=153914 RepID=A0AA39PSI0_9AGAR|nr:hypothetical protein IW261DRAFT_383972 [Armillaria novae-zelandiae]